MKFIRTYLLVVFCLALGSKGVCQSHEDRLHTIAMELERLSKKSKGLRKHVELSVSNSNIQEFIRGIAMTHDLNVAVAPEIRYSITNNFADAQVKDVFIFLCRQYKLDIQFVGSIIMFNKFIPKQEENQSRDTVEIQYREWNDYISMNLMKDTLDDVVVSITSKSPHNVLLRPEAKGVVLSKVKIQNRPFREAIRVLAQSCGLEAYPADSSDSMHYWIGKKMEFKKVASTVNTDNQKKTRRYHPHQKQSRQANGEIQVSEEFGLLTVRAVDQPIKDIIEQVSEHTKYSYFMYKVPTGKSTLSIENVSYEEFMNYILTGTNFTYRIEKDVFLIGERNLETLRQTILVRMENRRVEHVLQAIPVELKKGVEISEFVELNGLVLSGSSLAIKEVEDFIRAIDQVVPMVTIDVIIADVSNTRSLSTGLKMGLGNKPTVQTSTGSVDQDGVIMDLSTEAINNFVSGLSGTGLLNLGNVSPNFYVQLRALESSGDIKLKSTPTVATLNGHESTLKVGNEEYYLTVENQVLNNSNIGGNAGITQTQRWNSVSADLSVTIKPTVSKDEQVTLNVSVEQSDFTARISETAPPGKVTRSFESMIRVKNGDMVLLGGLEEKNTSSTGSGLPLLSRIPIIKWFFGSRLRKKDEKKLTIFIRPTITYE